MAQLPITLLFLYNMYVSKKQTLKSSKNIPVNKATGYDVVSVRVLIKNSSIRKHAAKS